MAKEKTLRNLLEETNQSIDDIVALFRGAEGASFDSADVERWNINGEIDEKFKRPLASALGVGVYRLDGLEPDVEAKSLLPDKKIENYTKIQNEKNSQTILVETIDTKNSGAITVVKSEPTDSTIEVVAKEVISEPKIEIIDNEQTKDTEIEVQQHTDLEIEDNHISKNDEITPKSNEVIPESEIQPEQNTQIEYEEIKTQKPEPEIKPIQTNTPPETKAQNTKSGLGSDLNKHKLKMAAFFGSKFSLLTEEEQIENIQILRRILELPENTDYTLIVAEIIEQELYKNKEIKEIKEIVSQKKDEDIKGLYVGILLGEKSNSKITKYSKLIANIQEIEELKTKREIGEHLLEEEFTEKIIWLFNLLKYKEKKIKTTNKIANNLDS